VVCGCDAWKAQSPRHGSDPEKQRVELFPVKIVPTLSPESGDEVGHPWVRAMHSHKLKGQAVRPETVNQAILFFAHGTYYCRSGDGPYRSGIQGP